MKKQFIDTWKSLHSNGYFENHRLYNFEVQKPSLVADHDIKNKTILDLGCGYGRHLAWFSQNAKYCIGLDIEEVLSRTEEFIYNNGDWRVVDLYDINKLEMIKLEFDYVFCRFVFQHISKEQAKEYFKFINEHLKIGGKVNLQFRMGAINHIEEGKEPRVEYTHLELGQLLSNFDLEYVDETKDPNHLYVIGKKVK